jgi:hypothetical protein
MTKKEKQEIDRDEFQVNRWKYAIKTLERNERLRKQAYRELHPNIFKRWLKLFI